MCSNYDEIDDSDRLLHEFGVSYSNKSEMLREVAKRRQKWPTDLAAFIRLHESGSGDKVIEHGTFGLLPGFAKEVAYGRRTYNARTETVHKLPSFRESWAKGWRCIVPVETLYEPNYESGKAVRWGVNREDGKALAVAGIYREWESPDGKKMFSFAMLTVNAEGHPVYSRFHKPGDEKRMVVILDDMGQQDDWLTCTVEEARKYFRQSPVPLKPFPAPLVRKYRGPQQAM